MSEINIDESMTLVSFGFQVEAKEAHLHVSYSSESHARGALLDALPDTHRAAAEAFTRLTAAPRQVTIDGVTLELESFHSYARAGASGLRLEYGWLA